MFYTFQDTAITLQNWNNTSNYSDSGRAIKKCLSTVKVDASSETLTRHNEDLPEYVLQYYQSMVATIAQYLEAFLLSARMFQNDKNDSAFEQS